MERVPAKQNGIAVEDRFLTRAEFRRLADVPPETEWFANLDNENTRRAYRHDVGKFIGFAAIERPEELRLVTRAHVLRWRKSLETRSLSAASIRRKLSALSALFDHLRERNAIQQNPVQGVKRPNEGANEGKTPAITDTQARALLDAPRADTLKGKRDRAILAVLLFHALRRAEVSALKVEDYAARRGIVTLCVHGKGGRIRYVPVKPEARNIWTPPATAATRRGRSLLFRAVKRNAGRLTECPTG